MLADAAKGEFSPVYLILGERYLCQQFVDDLVNTLLPDEKQRAHSLVAIDGDQENQADTLNQLRTYNLFGGRSVFRVLGSKLLYSKSVTRTLWDKAQAAFAGKDLKEAGRFLNQMLELIQETGQENYDALISLAASRWKTLFGFAKPDDLDWLREVPLDKDTGPLPPVAGDLAELYAKALEEGIPPANILILVADAVDKRKRLYKNIKENGAIIDLSVDPGASAGARKEQDIILHELIQKTLADFGKKLESGAIKELLKRVGFHPVAVVMETEKLALYVGDAPTITLADLDSVVGRTREDALFELTEAFVGGNLQESLLILARLRANGIHPLAILATLRNTIRNLLLVRSLQEMPQPPYKKGLPYPAFQQGYLPELKSVQGEDLAALAGHPYALFMTFRRAEEYCLDELIAGLNELLAAEFLLKGSNLPENLIMEEFLFKRLLTNN